MNNIITCSFNIILIGAYLIIENTNNNTYYTQSCVYYDRTNSCDPTSVTFSMLSTCIFWGLIYSTRGWRRGAGILAIGTRRLSLDFDTGILGATNNRILSFRLALKIALFLLSPPEFP